MDKVNLKSSLYRLLSDLIKADNIIAVDELNFLDEFCQQNDISIRDKRDGYQITLSQALGYLASCDNFDKETLIETMKRSTASDGDECNFSESILIQAAIHALNAPSAHIVSMPTKTLPVNKAQLIYIENADNGSANAYLSKEESFNEINNLAKLGGFEVIYIPRIAKHYSSYGNSKDLHRVLSLVSPAHSPEQIEKTVLALQHMTTRYFYQNVLLDKFAMPLDVVKPIWLVRLVNDVVDGADYANFLAFEVEKDIRAQLSLFISEVNSRVHEYPIIVNDRRDNGTDFLYAGFYKSILDVMSIKKIDRWELKIRMYGDGVEQYKDPATGKKTVMTICRDGKEYPLFLSGRDAAFYTMLLCASASNEGAVDFYAWEKGRKNQERFENIYQKLSRRSIDGTTEHQKCPDVSAQETRIPMKCRLMAAIKASNLTEQSLYMPQEKSRSVMYVPVDPEKIKLLTKDGEVMIRESQLFKEYIDC